MSELKVPSLQHLCRNWHDDPNVIKRRLLKLADRPPTFNYDPLFSAVRDHVVFGVSFEQIIKGMHRGVKRNEVRENYLSVLPLIQNYFDGITPSFAQTVERRYYSIGRKLTVPFNAPLIYGVGEKLFFPWFSFWRSNPISKEPLSLFVTLVEDVLLKDPDLKRADFRILDFSAPAPKLPRELDIVNASDVERLSDARKREMLDVFVKGYGLARAELLATTMAARKRQKSEEAKKPSPTDPDLFDPKGK